MKTVNFFPSHISAQCIKRPVFFLQILQKMFANKTKPHYRIGHSQKILRNEQKLVTGF